MGPRGDVWLVRDENDGIALLMQSGKKRHDFLARGGVEISRGLVRKQNRGRIHKSSGDRYALAGFFCLMPSFAPISWKSYFAALLVPYMLLTDELWGPRRLSAPAWALLVGSVLLNFLPGRRLNRIALFYSANFVSSLMVLAAVALVALARTRDPMALVPISAQAEHAG